MDDKIFSSDMIMDAAENAGFADSAEKSVLSDCIKLRKIEIKNAADAKKFGREKGIYITFDVTADTYGSNSETEKLEKGLSDALSGTFSEIRKRNAKILIAGLGNSEIAADSLGARVVPLIAVNAERKGGIYAFEAGVYGSTGIQSAVVVSALVKEIKPDLVIAVDSLATSSVSRIGKSYQLSTAGITPGSGVGGDRMRIDGKTLGVPVAAIGVPLVLSMRTLVNNLFAEYFRRVTAETNAGILYEMLMEKQLNGLIVAPKEIGFYADMCSSVIANAINNTFAN